MFWRKNIFKLPSGNIGKSFILEMTLVIHAWRNVSEHFKDIAVKVLMIMSSILLQKPSATSTSKDHSACLLRRFNWWEEGDFDKLMHESRAIQHLIK